MKGGTGKHPTKVVPIIFNKNMFEDFSNLTPDCYVELSDGALNGLATGANMEFVSSIVELTDNAVDANATKIKIVINRENQNITIFSSETTNLQKENAQSVLFKLGNSGLASTKANGVGKYKQGLKYALANLIGTNNKGLGRVECRPINGPQWAIVNLIDYTNPEHYTDRNLYFREPYLLTEKYNFVVNIDCATIPDDKEINTLIVTLGLRYRELIENDKIIIKVNDVVVTPQDRLYSKYGDRAGYHKPVYFSYLDNPKAFRWEYSDLCESHFNELEYITYDSTMGIKGRKSGVSVTKRAGVEIVANSVTLVYDGLLEELIDVQLQPSGAAFRGRLSINDNRVIDRYIRGGNKSKSEINKAFLIERETEDIRRAIKEAHSKALENYRKNNKCEKAFSNDMMNKWCDENNCETKFLFFDTDASRKTFNFDESNNIIEVNLLSNLFADMKNNSYVMLIIALIRNIYSSGSKTIFKTLNRFESDMIDFEVVNS